MVTAMKNQNKGHLLYKALMTLKTEEECRAFFADLCTITEIRAMEQRLEVAKMLSEGKVYNAIVEDTGASSATVSRVNRSLNHGASGYQTVLERLK